MPKGVYKRTKEMKIGKYIRTKETKYKISNKVKEIWESSEYRNNAKNKHTGKFGEIASNWKGGRIFNHNGYVWIYSPNHPNNTRRYVFEHRLVMEKHIGRYLNPKEVVHHINEIITDNRIENLMLFSNNGEHCKHHAFIRKQNIKNLNQS